jgi:hypothetical protein
MFGKNWATICYVSLFSAISDVSVFYITVTLESLFEVRFTGFGRAVSNEDELGGFSADKDFI